MSALFDRPASAEHETESGTTEPCLLLGVLDNVDKGDYPYFLIVNPDGFLRTSEIGYLRTNWRWDPEEKRWIDLGRIPVAFEFGSAGESGDEEDA